MPQFNLPKKIVSTVQLWASLLLIVLAFVFSMTPIITLNNVENADEIFEMMGELDLGDVGQYIEEETEVSSPKLISSISLLVKIVSAASDDEGQGENDLAEYLDTEEGKEAVATTLCLAASIVKTIDFEDSDGIFSVVFNVLVGIIGLFTVLLITLALPFVFGIIALISLIKALKNIKTPENAAPSLSRKLPGMISLPLILMLFQCVVPGMTYASGVVAICIISVVATVLNFVASRARMYQKDQFKYLNVVQGCSLVGIIGFLVFFFNIIRTGIFKAFISGGYAEYLTKALAAKDAGADVNGGYIVDGVLMIIYLVIMLSAVAYLEKAARRFSCSAKRERKRGLIGMFSSAKIKDNDIVAAILCLAAFIIPTYIAGAKHGYFNPSSTESTGDFSFLNLAEAQEGYLNGALVGIIIMIVAEIAVIVLKKVFCADIKAEDTEAVLTGNAKTPDEILAEAQQIVADAEAAAAAANAEKKTEE